MKKISTIIALALIVTIGSVYAAWNYSKGPAASSEITREINMAQVNTNSNKGTISVVPHDVVFLVDDKGGFVADLVGSGNFEVNFTPADSGVDQSVKDNGISMIATVTVSGDGATYRYDGKDVIPVKAKADNTIEINGGNPALTTTLDVADILSVLDFCVTSTGEKVDVKLLTKAENDAFHEILKDYTIVITISEVVTP